MNVPNIFSDNIDMYLSDRSKEYIVSGTTAEKRLKAKTSVEKLMNVINKKIRCILFLLTKDSDIMPSTDVLVGYTNKYPGIAEKLHKKSSEKKVHTIYRYFLHFG